MAVNKNFVVKNGIEVATDLIYATSDLDKVGIGSTIPTSTLEVGGDFKVTSGATVVGVATVNNTLDVGVGGTILTADIAGRVGLSTASPSYPVHISNVGSSRTSLYVDTGDVEIVNDVFARNITLSSNVNAGSLRVSGLSTFVGAVNIDGNVDMDADLHLTGVATITSDLTVGGNLNVTGDISYDEVTGRNINITGISTFGTVQISSGIVTATSGVVTYFGDGSNLTGIATELTATIGIKSEGTVIGSGITQIDFASSNGTAIAVDVQPATSAGVATPADVAG